MATRRFARKLPTSPIVLPRFSKRRLFTAALIGLGACFIGGATTVLWWSRDLPDPSDIDNRRVAESTKIFDRTGQNLLYEIGEIHRTKVTFDHISKYLRDATIAAEDDQFYSHRGIDLSGIGRAFLVNLRGQSRQGGSTITQQLIKNSILTSEKTYRRKVKEIVLALELEQRFSKDQILEMYLNDIPYGSQAYGVEAAAQNFFGVPAADLTLAQAAALASLPKAPSYYSPYGSHIEDLKGRQEYILDRMATLNMVNASEAEAAKKEPLAWKPRREAIRAPHFVFYVKELLDEQFGERVVEQGGLKVITSLDLKLQDIAEDILKKNHEKLKKVGASNAALVAINPKNGDILAMVGSADYFNEDIDGNVNVAIRHRSPGSSIKPFIYAAAWQKGYTPQTILVDAETDFGKGYIPKNFNLKENGPVTMKTALANSLNIPAVEALYLVGVKNATALAQKMGMTSLSDPDRYGLSLVLGGGEVRLVDEASAYGSFAAEGVHYPHRAIYKVENTEKVLFDQEKETVTPDEVVDPQVARLINDALSDNNARALVFGTRSFLQLGSRPVAAKTGTTQEFRDGWTLGYTPSLVTGVWVGNNDNSPIPGAEPGSRTAAPIWNEFMRRALEGTPIEQFTRPAPIEDSLSGILVGKLPEVKARYDSQTKTVLSLDCPANIGEPRTFQELHSILYYVRRDNPQGPPPERAENDPQFDRWEAAIAKWRDKYNETVKTDPTKPIYVPSLPSPSCPVQNADELPKVSIQEPNTTILTETPVTITATVDSRYPVKEVVFSLDGKEIGKQGHTDDNTYHASFSFDSNFSGRKTLLITAITDNNLLGKAHRTFVINPDDNPPSVTLHTPTNGTSLAAKQFPYTMKVTATDTTGIDFVDLLFKKEDQDGVQRITRVSTPTGTNRYDAVWKDSPGAGNYEVYAVAYDKTGNSTESEHHSVTLAD